MEDVLGQRYMEIKLERLVGLLIVKTDLEQEYTEESVMVTTQC